MTESNKPLIITELLTVSLIAAMIPGSRGSKTASLSTITRWITNGCPDGHGGIHKLKAVRAGGRWLIHPDELKSFFNKLSVANEVEPSF